MMKVYKVERPFMTGIGACCCLVAAETLEQAQELLVDSEEICSFYDPHSLEEVDIKTDMIPDEPMVIGEFFD